MPVEFFYTRIKNLPGGRSTIFSSLRKPMHSILVNWPTGAHIRLNNTFLISSTATTKFWHMFRVTNLSITFYSNSINLRVIKNNTSNEHLTGRASCLTLPSGMPASINCIAILSLTIPAVDISFIARGK